MYKNIVLKALLKRGPLKTNQLRRIVEYNVKRTDAFSTDMLYWLQKHGLIKSTGIWWTKRWHITRTGRLWLEDFGN